MLGYSDKSRVDEIDNSIAILVNLPSVQSELRWIPVTERLPERFGRFIVTIIPDTGTLWKTIEFAMYSDLMGLVKTPVFWKGNVGKSDFEDVTSKVTAWIPLPKPYKEETEDVEIQIH